MTFYFVSYIKKKYAKFYVFFFVNKIHSARKLFKNFNEFFVGIKVNNNSVLK